MKTTNRIISLMLAVLMLITFVLPVSAMEVEPVQEIIDMTGGTPPSADAPTATPGEDETSEPAVKRTKLIITKMPIYPQKKKPRRQPTRSQPLLDSPPPA